MLTIKNFSSKSSESGEYFQYPQFPHICSRLQYILDFFKKLALLVTFSSFFQMKFNLKSLLYTSEWSVLSLSPKTIFPPARWSFGPASSYTTFATAAAFTFSILQLESIFWLDRLTRFWLASPVAIYQTCQNKCFLLLFIILCIVERDHVNCPFSENGHFAFRVV